MDRLLVIIAAALAVGADYWTRLVAAYDAVTVPAKDAENATVKFIVRVDTLAKNGTTRAYVNRYYRTKNGGEAMECIAQAKGQTVAQATAWLQGACAALDKRTDVKLRSAKNASNVTVDALDGILAGTPTKATPTTATPTTRK